MKTYAVGEKESRPVSSLVLMSCDSRGRASQSESVSDTGPGLGGHKELSLGTWVSPAWAASLQIGGASLGQDPCLPTFHVPLISPSLSTEGMFSGKNS